MDMEWLPSSMDDISRQLEENNNLLRQVLELLESIDDNLTSDSGPEPVEEHKER